MQFNYIRINSFLISFLPIALIFSIFVAELLVVILSLSLIVFVILKKKLMYLILKNLKYF